MPRPTVDEYFMQLARVAATRATCDRAHVGCVIAKDGRTVATGYNGSPSGEAHCDEVGHMMVGGHCVRTRHAERNALDYAVGELQGATLYVTHSPCRDCTLRIIEAGIVRVVVGKNYGPTFQACREVLETMGVAVDESFVEDETSEDDGWTPLFSIEDEDIEARHQNLGLLYQESIPRGVEVRADDEGIYWVRGGDDAVQEIKQRSRELAEEGMLFVSEALDLTYQGLELDEDLASEVADVKFFLEHQGLSVRHLDAGHLMAVGTGANMRQALEALETWQNTLAVS